MTPSPRSPSRSPPGDRAALVGVRQLRHPVQGVQLSPACRATPEEKIADAAIVHKFTGVAPSVALHIPWDKVDDYAAPGGVRRRSRASRLGAINSNVFQDDDYKLGSVTNPDPRVRRKATDHLLECVDIMDADRVARPEAVVLRRHQLPGPGRHAGPAGPARRRRCARCTTGSATTSGCCWSTSCSSRPSTPPTCRTGARRTRTACELGPKATVCIDTGHHAPGTNIEFIVAFLLRLGKLGAFDFNSRFYADDDLMVGAADPFQLFRIMNEIVRGDALGPGPRDRASCSTSATTSRRRSRP